MITIHPTLESVITQEPNFFLFKHKELFCCVQRTPHFGNLNGYVAVPKEHSLYGKNYNDKVSVKKEPVFNGNFIGLLAGAFENDHELNIYPLSMAINVHCGLTYSRGELYGIDNNLLGELWWFGFDTVHSGDLKPFQTDIDRKYQISGEVYRDFNYVKEQTISLAEQLTEFA